MTDVQRVPGDPAAERQWSWRAAVAITTVVAIAGVGLTMNQFFINYLHDQNSHTRTLGGILMMLLGIASVGLPILLICRKQSFVSLGSWRGWLLAIAIPVLYVTVVGLCLEAALRSTTLILPRPELPLAVLRYRPNQTQIKFQGRWGGGGGSDNTEVKQGVEHFASHIDQGFMKGFLPGAPDHPDRRIITIASQATALQENVIQVTLDVDALEPFRFHVENLDDIQVSRDDQAIPNSMLPTGRYQVTVIGRLQDADGLPND